MGFRARSTARPGADWQGRGYPGYGLLTNERGLPVSVSVFKGQHGRSDDLAPRAGSQSGMITQKQVDALREIDGIVDRSPSVRGDRETDAGQVQMRLFGATQPVLS